MDNFFVSVIRISIQSTGHSGVKMPGQTLFIYLDESGNFDFSPTGTNYRDWETDRKSTRLNSSHRL